MDNELDEDEQAQFDEIFELSKAEAALALCVHFGRSPYGWAMARFEASLDLSEADYARENAETDVWVSLEDFFEHAAITNPNPTLRERLEAENTSAEALFEEWGSAYFLITLHAALGFSVQAVIITSGFSFTEIKRNVLGYVGDGGAKKLLRNKGILAEDFVSNGIKALPSFQQAVREAVELCEIGEGRDASRGRSSGIHAMTIAHHRSLHQSAARAFAEDYIAKNFCLPTGVFDVEFPYGPEQRVQSGLKNTTGVLKTSLCFSSHR